MKKLNPDRLDYEPGSIGNETMDHLIRKTNMLDRSQSMSPPVTADPDAEIDLNKAGAIETIASIIDRKGGSNVNTTNAPMNRRAKRAAEKADKKKKK